MKLSLFSGVFHSRNNLMDRAEQPLPETVVDSHFCHAGKKLLTVHISRQQLLETLVAAQRDPAQGQDIHYVILKIDGALYKLVNFKLKKDFLLKKPEGEVKNQDGKIIKFDPQAAEEFVDSLWQKTYLIPHYELTHDTPNRRKQQLVRDRAQRFFYSAEQGLDVMQSKEEILDEIADYRAALARVQRQSPNFYISRPFHQMSDAEKDLLMRGKELVGHLVNRVDRLGRAVMQRDNHGIGLEYSEAYIQEHLDQVASEFQYFWSLLVLDEDMACMTSHWQEAPTRKDGEPLIKGADLVRCVHMREGQPDHDGVLGYFIHEIGKTITAEIHHGIKGTQDDEATNLKNEVTTRIGIIDNIGRALEAIDEANAALTSLVNHEQFSRFLRGAKLYCMEHDATTGGATMKPDLSEYRSKLDDFARLARQRACIRSEDAANFNQISRELRARRIELGDMNEKLMEIAEQPFWKGNMKASIEALQRGTQIINEMAELRLPRNRTAPAIYDKDRPEFARKDASTVGRLAEKIRVCKELWANQQTEWER